jgi:hypothetical protein
LYRYRVAHLNGVFRQGAAAHHHRQQVSLPRQALHGQEEAAELLAVVGVGHRRVGHYRAAQTGAVEMEGLICMHTGSTFVA